MALQNLKIETLGEKHKNYNNLIKDAIAGKKRLDETEFVPGKQELNNLMKIDIASNDKNVNYIISVLKCKDTLYVSRALNRSRWLVDDQYEHIINPQNLEEHLLPQMTTEAGTKLTKFIRQNLKNESRVEEFLKNETNPKVAAKWLSRCSISFIKKNIQTYLNYLENLEFKRLFEKSVTIFDAALDKNDCMCRVILKSAYFLINTHFDKYLDAVERATTYERPSFNAKATNRIMNKDSERVKNKFEIYSALIHIPTFVKHLKSEEIKGFLYKQVSEDDINSYQPPRFYKYATIKHFVMRLPKEEQFEFVKSHFIDKAMLLLDEDTLQRGTEIFASRLLCKAVCSITPSYVWYEFAPFEIAFTEIKKLLDSETNNREKSSMLRVLLICTAKDMKHLQTVLSYYLAQHAKDEIHLKDEFISNLIASTDIHKYDDPTWDLLDKIFITMEVYIEAVSTQQNCLEAVIMHNLLKNKPIPEVIEKKLSFYTLKDYQKKLGKENGNIVFDYLYNHAMKILQNKPINSQDAFSDAVAWVKYLLNLLLDWNKDLADYTFILGKIKDLIKIKKENNWKADLTELYNKNKSWRKLMFEESVILYPSEKVCVNALKHDPGLLERYKDEVEAIRCNDTLSLENLLKKLKIYWPNSLADEWSKYYVARLDQLGNHRALIRGICAILPETERNNIIKKYIPQEAKIDWSKIDELSLSLQRAIAKNMHIARPQPSPEDILLYAQGDYLQYALPSLLAIYYNLSRVESKEQVPKLLDAPVSLQKHGLRLAFIKLDHNELKLHMANVWNTSKNSSIRTVVFQLMFELLRKEKNDGKAQELWELLEVFIDNLSFQEDDKIYDLLPRVSDVPLCIRPLFLMKSYKFMKNLVQNTKKDRNSYQYHVDRLAEYTRDIMEFMPSEFVADIITEFINEKLFEYDKYQNDVRSGGGMITVLSAYLLCTKDEAIQMQRYDELLSPVFKRSFDNKWDEKREGSYFIRRHIQQILRCLLTDLTNYVIKNKMIIPTKMYTKIQNEIQYLPVSENYLMITMWRLTAKLSELIGESKEEDWNKISIEIVPEFGKFCLEYLKQDVKLYFPCINVLFSRALGMIIGEFSIETQLKFFEYMLCDSNFIQAYLATMNAFPKYGCDDETTTKKQQLKNIIQEHSSVEVKMHYYSNFKSED